MRFEPSFSTAWVRKKYIKPLTKMKDKTAWGFEPIMNNFFNEKLLIKFKT